MEKNSSSTLRLWSFSLKTVATCAIFTILMGYTVSLVQIYNRTSYDLSRAVEYYRGDETGENVMKLPQTFTTMLSISHVHTLSQPLMFALLGFIFSFSALSERKKAFFIILAFSGSVASNSTPWLIRYVQAPFVWLFPLSQAAIFVSMMVMSWTSLKGMWSHQK